MVEILKQVEGMPTFYPPVTGLSPEALALNQDALWQRLEAYVAWRWSPRLVTWTVSGEAGQQWSAPLAPISDHAAKGWDNGAWQTRDILEGPMGLIIPHRGSWRISATVGDDVPLPEAVGEAFRRLAEFAAAQTGGMPGASSYSINIGQLSESWSMAPAFMARALDNSGAADLLRPYRRA